MKKNLFKTKSNFAPYFITAVVIIASFAGFRYQYDLLTAAQDAFNKALMSTNDERTLTQGVMTSQGAKLRKLAKEREELISEKENLVSDLAEVRNILNETAAAFESSKKEAQKLNREKSGLIGELAGLKVKYDEIAIELDRTANEKYLLEKKFTDLGSLKQMIKQMRKEVRLARARALKELDRAKLAQGNRGYMVKDGENVYNKGVVITVSPLNN